MGLFSKPEGWCHFRSGKVVSGQNGVHCNECETFIHTDCLKNHGLTKMDDKLLRRDRVHLRCRSCEHEGTIKL